MSKNIDFNALKKTIKKVDSSVLQYFKQTLNLKYDSNGNPENINVLWATGEKWYQIKNNKFIRDKNGSIILPIITVSNLGIENNPANNLIAALPSTQRFKIGKTEVIKNDSKNGVEYIQKSIKYPKQAACNYQVNIWAQYIGQMNDIIEQILTDKTQVYQQAFCIEDKESPTYRYTALLEYPINSQDNLSEIQLEERIIIKTLNFKIPFIFITDKSDPRTDRVMVKMKFNIGVK